MWDEVVYLRDMDEVLATRSYEIGVCLSDDQTAVLPRQFNLSLLEIGDEAVIGGHSTVIGHSVERGRLVLKKVKIGKRVTIGLNSVILPGAQIGDGAIIAAGAVLMKDAVVEPRSVFVGVPAINARERHTHESDPKGS